MTVVMNGGNAIPSFLTKWQTLAPYASQFSPQAQQAVLGLDLGRLQRGSQGLSQNEALIGLQAAQDQNTHLPSPHQSGVLGALEDIASGAKSDIQNIATNLPHIPGEILKTASQLPQAPADIQKAISDHSLAEFARTPGINLIPGSFIAQNLSHPSQLLKHPVMSALDVMPYTAEGMDLIPDAYKAQVADGVGKVFDKFGMGPVAEGTSRIMNVARREQGAAEAGIVDRFTKLTKDWSPEEKEVARQALLAEPSELRLNPSDDTTEQMTLPLDSGAGVLPPELMSKIESVKSLAQEWKGLQQQIKSTAYEGIRQQYAQTADTLKDVFSDSMKKLTDQGLNEQDAFKTVVRQNNFEPWTHGGEDLYVPKTVNQVLDRLENPYLETGFGKVYKRAMDVFRTAVIPLSLHWQTVHALGTTALVAADEGIAPFTKMGEAWDMVRNRETPLDYSQAGSPFVQPKTDADLLNVARGKGFAEMLNSSQFKDYARMASKPLSAVINGSYRVSNLIDQMAGAMSYLTGKDRALAEGLTEEEAHARGIAQANKVLHDWDGITPVERDVLRTVFPFYPWMKTITKYMARYPLEHPMVTSIMTNFAKNELADQKTAIPGQFANYFTIGHANKEGITKALSVNRLNPFSDISSLFTLGGLLGQTNPFISGLGEALGLNPTTGAAPAFPKTVFNPQTGKQEAVHRNPLAAIAENFVPQVTGLSQLFGFAPKDIQNLKTSDPAAYQNILYSSLGLPHPTTVNFGQEAAKSEINKYQALQSNVDSIIRSGDFNKLREYGDAEVPFSGGGSQTTLVPASRLADYLDQLSQLGALNKFNTAKSGVQNLTVPSVLGALGLG